MNSQLTDRQKIEQGILPCCGRPIKRYLVDVNTPMCELCDTYFQISGSNNEWVVRTDGANEEYNRIWNDIIKDSEEELGI